MLDIQSLYLRYKNIESPSFSDKIKILEIEEGKLCRISGFDTILAVLQPLSPFNLIMNFLIMQNIGP